MVFGNPVPISGRAKVFHNHRAVLDQVGDYFTLDFFLYELRRFIFPFNFDLFANRGFGPFEQFAVYLVIFVTIIFLVIFLKSGHFKEVLKMVWFWFYSDFLVVSLFFLYTLLLGI